MEIKMIAYRDHTGSGCGDCRTGGDERCKGGWEPVGCADARGEAYHLVTVMSRMNYTVIDQILYPSARIVKYNYRTHPVFQDTGYGTKFLNEPHLWYNHPLACCGVGCEAGHRGDYKL